MTMLFIIGLNAPSSQRLFFVNKTLNQFQVFIIRAIIGVVFAVIITRAFYGHLNILYVAGLAVILVGLAYFAEYLRNRESR